MTGPDCDACRSLAAELALGIAVGDERAAALEHLSVCASCRRDLEGLTATLDTLLSVAPEMDPPAGFEERVLAGLHDHMDGPAASPPRPRGRRPRARVAVLVAAVLVAVCGIGAAFALLREDEPAPRSAETADGQVAASVSRMSGTLTTPDGTEVGRVALVPGGSTEQGASRLVVSLGPVTPDGTYRVECDYESGRPYVAGTLTTSPGGTDRWTGTVSVPTYDLRRVRLVSTTGGENLEADVAA